MANAQRSSACEMNSGPLSTVIPAGRPCRATNVSSTRATRPASERRVDFDAVALARVRIDDVERAEATTVGEVVVDEVHRPALIRMRRRRQRHRPHGTELLARALSYRQSFASVEPINALAIHDPTFTHQQDVQASVAEPRTLSGELAHPRHKRCRLHAPMVIATRRTMQLRERARTTLTDSSRLQELDNLPSHGSRHHLFPSAAFIASFSSANCATSCRRRRFSSSSRRFS